MENSDSQEASFLNKVDANGKHFDASAMHTGENDADVEHLENARFIESPLQSENEIVSDNVIYDSSQENSVSTSSGYEQVPISIQNEQNGSSGIQNTVQNNYNVFSQSNSGTDGQEDSNEIQIQTAHLHGNTGILNETGIPSSPEVHIENESEMPSDSRMQVETVYTTISNLAMSQTATQAAVSPPMNTCIIQMENVADDGMMQQSSQYSDQNSVQNQMPCMICGDRGSGYHYSVYSCEGCKGFFKRSVQKNLLYQCKDQGKCVINKFTRNSCQHCRYRKCMEMGMKREAVREDRSPGGKHRHKRQRLDEITAAVFGSGMSQGINLEVDDKIISGLINAKPDVTPKVEGNLGLKNMGINELMQYGYAELKYIIDWAKKVPGFSELCIEDQMALLKSSFMELNVLRLSFRSMDTDNCIRFVEGLLVPVELAKGMGWGKDLVAATVEFSKRLKDLTIDNTEFCILNGIVLTYPDACGITEKTKVTLLQSNFLDSLRRYELHQYPNDKRRYGKMLLRLPSLRTISAKAAERFLSLTLDGTIQLNDLVLEMIN